jgi:hypothetical protein
MADPAPVAVLHVGPAWAIHRTFSRATLGDIDILGAAFIDINIMGTFEQYIMANAMVVYFVDMALWGPVFQAMAVKLVRMANGTKEFIRMDMYSMPLPSPWIGEDDISDDIKFLDFLPLVTVYSITAPHLFTNRDARANITNQTIFCARQALQTLMDYILSHSDQKTMHCEE